MDDQYPDPKPEDLADPEFEAIWQAIKGWDIGGGKYGELRAGAQGNDVMHILLAVRRVRGPDTTEWERSAAKMSEP